MRLPAPCVRPAVCSSPLLLREGEEREGGEGRRVQVGCWVELDKTCRHRVGLLTTERAIRAPLDPELIQSLGFGVWSLGFRGGSMRWRTGDIIFGVMDWCVVA